MGIVDIIKSWILKITDWIQNPADVLEYLLEDAHKEVEELQDCIDTSNDSLTKLSSQAATCQAIQEMKEKEAVKEEDPERRQALLEIAYLQMIATKNYEREIPILKTQIQGYEERVNEIKSTEIPRLEAEKELAKTKMNLKDIIPKFGPPRSRKRRTSTNEALRSLKRKTGADQYSEINIISKEDYFKSFENTPIQIKVEA